MTAPDIQTALMHELHVIRVVLSHILTALDNIEGMENSMAKKLAEYVADINAKIAALTANVAAQTSIVGSAKTLLEGLTATVAALKQQVQDLIDAGGDVTTLQPVLDMLTAQEAALKANGETLMTAVVQNTPAA